MCILSQDSWPHLSIIWDDSSQLHLIHISVASQSTEITSRSLLNDRKWHSVKTLTAQSHLEKEGTLRIKKIEIETFTNINAFSNCKNRKLRTRCDTFDRKRVRRSTHVAGESKFNKILATNSYRQFHNKFWMFTNFSRCISLPEESSDSKWEKELANRKTQKFQLNFQFTAFEDRTPFEWPRTFGKRISHRKRIIEWQRDLDVQMGLSSLLSYLIEGFY